MRGKEKKRSWSTGQKKTCESYGSRRLRYANVVTRSSRSSLVLIYIPPVYLSPTTVGDLFQWVQGICDSWIAVVLKCTNTNRIGAMAAIPPVDTCMDRIVLLGYFTSADHIDIKYFPCRHLPSMPGTDYDLVINVHICRNGVPDHAGATCPWYFSGIWEAGLTMYRSKPAYAIHLQVPWNSIRLTFLTLSTTCILRTIVF